MEWLQLSLSVDLVIFVYFLVNSFILLALFDTPDSPSSSLRHCNQVRIALLNIIVFLAHLHKLLISQVIAIVDLLADPISPPILFSLRCSVG